MKVDIVEFVENEMVEMNVAQIGLNWGWIEVECGDENDYGDDECGDECGDECAKKIKITAFSTLISTLIIDIK